MTEERKEIWKKYTESLCKLRNGTDVLYRMKGAMFFLENAKTLNKRGYNRLKKEHAYELTIDKTLRNGVLLFLDYLGVGYRKTSSVQNVQTLEKLSTISEKNRQLMNEFIRHTTEQQDYSRHTIDLYANSIKKFFEYATEFNNENCRRFIATMSAEGFSPQTIRLRITALEKLGVYLKSPVTLKRPKMVKQLHTENIPTEAEYERLLDYLKTRPDKIDYLYVKILATTGARVSEFLKITWDDILKGEVVLCGKGNKYRRFFFSKKLQKEVKAYLSSSPRTGLVCVNRYGKSMSTRGFDCKLKHFAKKTGIDKTKLHAHAFRHFFAKMYLKKTKDVVQLAELLGHRSVDTTRIYLQKSYEEQKRDFNRNITW